MKSFFKKHGLSIFYLIFLSCIPLLWYSSGTIGLGHDMGWSLVPLDRFFDRLFSWTPTAFGYDQSLEIGAITIYAIPAFLSAVHLPIITVQKITYIIWFFSMASSMYYMTQVIYKGKYSRLIAILAATFYVMNHYTLQAWTVAEFSKFSVMTIFPILFAHLWLVSDKKMSTIKGAAITGLFFFIFNGGGGSGIPLYGGMLISISLLFLYKWLIEKVSLIHLVKTYITFGFAIFLVNLYWIIPLIGVVKTQYSPFASSGGPAAAVAWTDVISKNTSLINLFRLQGFSDWYDTINHPYAPVFLNNPLFVLLSYLFPLVAFTAYFLHKDKNEKKILLFFSLLALFAMIFVGGTHEPFGVIYTFLMTKVYGFAIFRTAFYKFGYALWFAYAILFAFGAVRLISLFKKEIILKIGFVLIFLFIGFYNYPFFTASFFNFDLPFKTMIQLPSYIVQARDYMETLPQNDRVLLVPPPSPTNGQSDVYTFGYFSRTPLPFELTQKSVVTNVEVNSDNQEKLTEALYTALQQNNEEEAKKLMHLLGISHILLRGDVLTNSSQYRITPPDAYSKNFLSYHWIKQGKQFGQWTFYTIVDSPSQISAIKPNIAIISNNLPINGNGISADKVSVSDIYQNILPQNATHTISATCETCYKPNVNIFPHATRVVLLPTSPLYFLIQREEEKNLKNSASDPFFRLGFDLFYAERHALSLQQLSDQDVHKDMSSLDQYQRYTILKSYESLITDAQKKFSELSNIQKLQSINEVNDSFENQRRLIRSLGTSNFIQDNEMLFNSIYDKLNIFLDAKETKDILQQKQTTLFYSVNISQSGRYVMAVKDSSATMSATIDGQKTKSNIVLLTAGAHSITLPLSWKNVLTKTNFSVDGKQTFSADLSNLKPSQLYNLALSFHNNGASAVRVEVLDDLHNYKFFQIVNPNSALDTQEVKATFTTNSAIAGPYTVKITTEQEGTTSSSITITNFSIQEITSPQIIFSDDSFSNPQQTTVPNVTVKQINPSKYQVSITNAKDPYMLLFRQTFSSFWIAKINNQEKISSHFAAYNAFNGWYITKEGTYTITLTFDVQKFYILGVLGSTIGIVILVIALGIVIKKNK